MHYTGVQSQIGSNSVAHLSCVNCSVSKSPGSRRYPTSLCSGFMTSLGPSMGGLQGGCRVPTAVAAPTAVARRCGMRIRNEREGPGHQLWAEP